MAKSPKSSLALTREQFRSQAKAIPVVINGKELVAAAKEFSTGSLGWNINDKMQVDVGGQIVTVQVGMNLTIIGSKDIPPDASSPVPAAASPAAAPAASPPAGGSDPTTGQADF